MPSLSQILAAVSIADALSYLHSRRIIFRDLKPANIGFDNEGTLKLFDFGFAIKIDSDLHDRCGTPRYMAPEVGLDLGYHLPSDVYSFGILLWEICALKKPFGTVRSAAEFEEKVFNDGARPKLRVGWPLGLTRIMQECWATLPAARPTITQVHSRMAALAKEVARKNEERRGNSRHGSMFRRVSII